MDDLLAHNVVVEGKQPEQQSVWTQLLVASFLFCLFWRFSCSLCARCRWRWWPRPHELR